MKKSKRKIAKSDKMSPEKLKNISGGNQVTRGFERMPTLDPQQVLDALKNRRNNRNS
ncbi:MAG TPA: hypothetical protein PK657_09530 [Legionella sp.]|nr:hypothetical protein [Legionella sp.]